MSTKMINHAHNFTWSKFKELSRGHLIILLRCKNCGVSLCVERKYKFKKWGMSDKAAKAKAARIYNVRHPKNPVKGETFQVKVKRIEGEVGGIICSYLSPFPDSFPLFLP